MDFCLCSRSRGVHSSEPFECCTIWNYFILLIKMFVPIIVFCSIGLASLLVKLGYDQRKGGQKLVVNVHDIDDARVEVLYRDNTSTIYRNAITFCAAHGKCNAIKLYVFIELTCIDPRKKVRLRNRDRVRLH